MGGPPHSKRPPSSDPDVGSIYVSPVKRVKQALQTRMNKQVIETVDDLKAFVKKNDMSNTTLVGSIVLVARVVWTSYDVCKTGPVARLHLIDKRADEDLDDMHKVLREGYDQKKGAVDSELITASLYGVDKKTKGVPRDGSIIRINRVWKLTLYADQACQLTTSLASIEIDIDIA